MLYYILENKERKGPFSLEQLAEMGISPDTMVWCKGMANWTKASEVEELAGILTSNRVENIKCKECGELFNANLTECPNCGCPALESLEKKESSTESSEKNNGSYMAEEKPTIPNESEIKTHSTSKMFDKCPECGRDIANDAKWCPHCGAKGKTAPMDYGDAIYDCFCRKYASFSGRSRRSEVFPFLILTGLLCGTLFFFKPESAPFESSPKPELIPFLITLLPTLGAIVRRLHDIGRSGWWVILPIIPEIFIFKDSDKEENEYGKSPKYQPESFTEELPDKGTTIGLCLVIGTIIVLLLLYALLQSGDLMY